jgi:hypothetical protein
MLAPVNNIEGSQPAKADSIRINTLIASLSHSNVLVRQRARYALVEMGEPAVDTLIEALNIRNTNVHWQVAKALRQIASPKSTEALVKLLQDDEMGIRWIAAEGLITIGEEGLGALLETLIDHSASFTLRESAYHVLYTLAHQPGFLNRPTKALIYPVLEALAGNEPAMNVPIAAYKARQQFQQEHSSP